MTETVLLAFCTCPNEVVAEAIADILVGEKLAACVNLLPGIRSIYAWQGEIQRDAEVMLLIKTSTARFVALTQRLPELHPYDLPEIIAIPVSHGLPPYLEWVLACTSDAS
jgi:periplasmic divalent cation tolerance protein